MSAVSLPKYRRTSAVFTLALEQCWCGGKVPGITHTIHTPGWDKNWSGHGVTPRFDRGQAVSSLYDTTCQAVFEFLLEQRPLDYYKISFRLIFFFQNFFIIKSPTYMRGLVSHFSKNHYLYIHQINTFLANIKVELASYTYLNCHQPILLLFRLRNFSMVFLDINKVNWVSAPCQYHSDFSSSLPF